MKMLRKKDNERPFSIIFEKGGGSRQEEIGKVLPKVKSKKKDKQKK
jgi:hypothetical protein